MAKYEFASDDDIEQSLRKVFVIADIDGNKHSITNVSIFRDGAEDSAIKFAKDNATRTEQYLTFEMFKWPSEWHIWQGVLLNNGHVRLVEKLSSCSEIVEEFWLNPTIRLKYGSTFAVAHRLATKSDEQYSAIGVFSSALDMKQPRRNDIRKMVGDFPIYVEGEKFIMFAFRKIEDAVMFKLSLVCDDGFDFDFFDLENL